MALSLQEHCHEGDTEENIYIFHKLLVFNDQKMRNSSHYGRGIKGALDRISVGLVV